MEVFRDGADWYTSQPIAQQILPSVALAVILLVVVFAGLHLLRRGLRPPRFDAGAAPPSGGRFERFELGARFYHWGNFVFLLVLIISAIPLYIPGSLPPIGVSWLLVHEIAAALFIVGLVVHIIFSFWRADPRTMWFGRGDWRDIKAFAGFYGGGRRSLPKSGKYDVWQKIYHAFLTLLSIAVIGTGVSMFLNAEALTDLSHGWMRWQRLIHQGAAILFVAVILGHTYVRLCKLNWPKAAAIFTGRIDRTHFEEAHDWNRWQPHATDGAAQPRAKQETAAR